MLNDLSEPIGGRQFAPDSRDAASHRAFIGDGASAMAVEPVEHVARKLGLRARNPMIVHAARECAVEGIPIMPWPGDRTGILPQAMFSLEAFGFRAPDYNIGSANLRAFLRLNNGFHGAALSADRPNANAGDPRRIFSRKRQQERGLHICYAGRIAHIRFHRRQNDRKREPPFDRPSDDLERSRLPARRKLR